METTINTFLSYTKIVAPIATAVTSALTPFEGKHAWFVALVAGMGALSLIAPTILPSTSQPPKQ